MKLYKLILFCTLLTLCAACEEVVDNPELLYKEKIVVRAVLEDGLPIEKIYFSRTMDPLETPPQSPLELAARLRLTDVKASITVDGTTSYMLEEYIDSIKVNHMTVPAPLFRTAQPVLVKAGSTYELNVEWNGKKAYSKTFVPQVPTIDSVSLKEEYFVYTSEYIDFFGNRIVSQDTSFYLRAIGTFTPRSGEVYGATIRVLHRDDKGSVFERSVEMNFDQVSGREKAGSDGKLSIATQDAYIGRDQPGRQDSVVYTLYAIDQAFQSYYTTRWLNEFNGGGFITGSSQRVQWNVQGEAIGMFIGQSSSTRSVLRRK